VRISNVSPQPYPSAEPRFALAKTDLARHVVWFANRDGYLTIPSIYRGFRNLGVPRLASLIHAFVIQHRYHDIGEGFLGLHIDINQIHRARNATGSSVWGSDGNVDRAQLYRALSFVGADGRFTQKSAHDLVDANYKRAVSMMGDPGGPVGLAEIETGRKISHINFSMLFAMALGSEQKGKTPTLSRSFLHSLYEGGPRIFIDLANAKQAAK